MASFATRSHPGAWTSVSSTGAGKGRSTSSVEMHGQRVSQRDTPARWPCLQIRGWSVNGRCSRLRFHDERRSAPATDRVTAVLLCSTPLRNPWTAAVTVSIDGHCSGLLRMVHIARCVTTVPSGDSSSHSSGSLPTTRYPSRSYRRWASVLTRSPAGRCNLLGATTSHRIPAAVNPVTTRTRSGAPHRPTFHRPGQLLEPGPDPLVKRSQRG